MKQKIKLKDLTEKQYETWCKENCDNMNCKTCPFYKVQCSLGEFCWVRNKDIYSNKFLDQEVEIEVPELLTKEEKEYLEGAIKPFKEVIVYIKKVNSIGKQFQFIHIKLCNGESIYLPYFNFKEYYKNMKEHKEYTLKELDLER